MKILLCGTSNQNRLTSVEARYGDYQRDKSEKCCSKHRDQVQSLLFACLEDVNPRSFHKSSSFWLQKLLTGLLLNDTINRKPQKLWVYTVPNRDGLRRTKRVSASRKFDVWSPIRSSCNPIPRHEIDLYDAFGLGGGEKLDEMQYSKLYTSLSSNRESTRLIIKCRQKQRRRPTWRPSPQQNLL